MIELAVDCLLWDKSLILAPEAFDFSFRVGQD